MSKNGYLTWSLWSNLPDWFSISNLNGHLKVSVSSNGQLVATIEVCRIHWGLLKLDKRSKTKLGKKNRKT